MGRRKAVWNRPLTLRDRAALALFFGFSSIEEFDRFVAIEQDKADCKGRNE